jgi:modification methylase
MKSTREIKSTKTTSFGSTKRENHDSSKFYARKLYQNNSEKNTEEVENNLGKLLDKVICQDSREMKKIPDSSVHLMITSPPYNVGKDYDEDLDLTEYKKLLKDVFTEVFRVLINGGRVCVNIANIGRKPYIPYHKFIIDIMNEIGFLMRGEIIWNKGAGAGTSTAWGSWKSSSNPTLRDVHEYILIFSKGKYQRIKNNKESTISRDEFLEYTKSIWNFQPERAKKVGHPAPFPVELAYRCIQLYSFKDEIILDPFCGVGATAIAAIKSERHFVIIDNNKKYVSLAKKRIKELSC